MGTGFAPFPLEMPRIEPIPIVRCHLGPGDDPWNTLRYVRLAEFEMWRFLMETRHRRDVVVEEVSLWVPDDATLMAADIDDPELGEAVVRICFETPGWHGVPVPVERFLPAQTYPEAQAALMSHFEAASSVTTTAGYFVPAGALAQAAF